MSAIPKIEFTPGHIGVGGFEIIKVEKIRDNREHFETNPEQPHQLNFFNLTFYTRGKSKQLIDFKWYPIERNTMVYLAKKQVTAFSFEKDMEGYCLLFSQEYLERCFGHLDQSILSRLFTPQLFNPTLQIPETSDLEQYIRLLYKEFYESDTNNRAIIDSLFTIILTKAEAIKNTQLQSFTNHSGALTLSKFVQLLEENYSRNRNANYYADQIGITYKHLNNTCKSLLNKTAKELIDDFVILEAKRRLTNNTTRSTNLAYELGFDDPTNFVKYFKNLTGLTPKQFKNNLI